MTLHIQDGSLIIWTLAACCLAVILWAWAPERSRLRAGFEAAFWLAWNWAWLDGQRIRLRVLAGMRQAHPSPEVTEARRRHPAGRRRGQVSDGDQLPRLLRPGLGSVAGIFLLLGQLVPVQEG